MKENIHFSIISPVYQAEQMLDELIRRLTQSLNFLNKPYEIILVDDGSWDKSWDKIKHLSKTNPKIKGIRLSRNFGQHAAISAGIKAASGEWAIVMDCDLQDQPEEISKLYTKAREGFDIVFASRIQRNDSFLKRSLSKVFYKILSFLSGSNYDHTIANFGIFHRSVINSVLEMPEKIRFFPAMVRWVGYKSTTIPVEHARRAYGESTYDFKRQLKLSVDIMLAYSNRPLRIIIGLGISISFIAFVFGLITILKALAGKISVSGYASLVVMLSFLSGIIITVLGVIGLYIGKIFEGIKDRPIYLIRENLNVKD